MCRSSVAVWVVKEFKQYNRINSSLKIDNVPALLKLRPHTLQKCSGGSCAEGISLIFGRSIKWNWAGQTLLMFCHVR